VLSSEIQAKRAKKTNLTDTFYSSQCPIYSRSTDYASGLRIAGSLLLGEADSFAHCRIAKGVNKIEQLNIEGKRSGEGFVAHKAILINALSRALADRVIVNDITLGRKGFLTYLKALGGSNIVKVVPMSNGNASGSQVAAKKLKVLYVSDDCEWLLPRCHQGEVGLSQWLCYYYRQ
jgi:hypothetical protein